MILKYDNRLIAFLDVLGFSSKLEEIGADKLHEIYSQFIDRAKTETFFKTSGDNTGRTNFEFAQFLFDSIVLVSNPIDDVYNVNNFISSVSLLLELGFQHGLPLRGAITAGDFLQDKERSIFLSSAFKDLVSFEQQQEWSGCSVLKQAEDIVKNAIFGEVDINPQLQIRNQLIHYYKVPLKQGKSADLFVINFLFFLSEAIIVEALNSLIEPKRKNTKEYFDYLKDSTPIELQSLAAEFHPAVMYTTISTRSGLRMKFLDSEGKECKPGIESFSIVALGSWK